MEAADLNLLENLRLLAAQIPDNIMLLDRQERIQFINWTVPDLTIEQVLGTPPYDYLPPAHRQRAHDLYSAVLREGTSGRIDVEYVAEDGSVSKFETRATPLMRDGKIEGCIVVSTNVTEREAAAADRDRFFSLSLDMLCVATLTGHFKRVSPAFSRVLGWTESELLTRPFLDFVHEDDREATTSVLGKLGSGEDVINFENRYRHKEGGFRTLSWKAIARPELGVAYAVARDVTAQRELEARLLQAQKMEAVGQLAGGMAHDFNNLLLAITMNAQAARRRVPDGKGSKNIDEIIAISQKASALTRQLLTFSRRQPVNATPTGLNDLLEGMMDMLRRTIPESIELVLTPERPLPSVLADRGQIEQVVLNLCINARDALPDGGRIVMQTELVTVDEAFRQIHPWASTGRYALLSVDDNGVGMTPEVQQRVFEPFFTTKPQGEGTGLGLAMVYGIVQQHEGLIHVYSEPGSGTSVKIYLPVSDQSAQATNVQPEESLSPGGSEKILVAEDAKAVREIVVEILEEAGYRVIVAVDGTQAVARFKEHPDISLALLDVVMPKSSGPEAARTIRTMQPETKILFTSGYSDGHVIGETIAREDLVRKPYNMDFLLQRVRDALDRA